MKFSINKTELQNALNIVQKGVSTRSTLPVLSGILISASGDEITLQSTDLELSIKLSVPALVEEPGKTVVPGKLFSDFVKRLPDAAIHIKSEEGSASITCDNTSFSVRTLNSEDFPGFPDVTANESITLPFSMFAKMVRRVAKIVSRDETRAILTGVLIEMNDGKLRMVSTDSYRMALTEVELGPDNYKDAEEFSVVIGGNFLNEIAGLSSVDDKLTIGIADNQIIIGLDNTTFINRRIEGTYPNYRQLLPDSYTTRATFNTEELLNSVHRAELVSTSSAPLKFSLSPEVNLVQLTVNSADTGSIQENIDCAIEGEPVEIAFNSKYVSDGISSVKTDEVYFDVQSSLKPGIFRSVGEENYLHLIMPVKI